MRRWVGSIQAEELVSPISGDGSVFASRVAALSSAKDEREGGQAVVRGRASATTSSATSKEAACASSVV
jgi:hypothetical protein